MYCSMQSEAADNVEKLKKVKPEFKAFLEQDLPAWRGLKLEDYLVKPFQRITRYPLLVREILKVTPKSLPNYPELEKSSEILNQLVGKANAIVKEQGEKKMNTEVWNMLESSPVCNEFIKTNEPLIANLTEFSPSDSGIYRAPKIWYYCSLLYRKENSVSYPGVCILFENALFLCHGKPGNLTVNDLIPFISLQIQNHKHENVISTPSQQETEAKNRAEAASKVMEAEQDDKEISYLVHKFVRFERLFHDEVSKAKHLFDPLMNNNDLMEFAFPILSSLAVLREEFKESLDKVEELLLSVPAPEINWLDIYLIFMQLMPKFEDLGQKIYASLPQFYNQSYFSEELNEVKLIEILQQLFQIVDHTPAYVRSAARILRRVPDDPNLTTLLATYRMIESSVKSMTRLRSDFDRGIEVLAITSRIRGENLFSKYRQLIYHGNLRDHRTQRRIKCCLFNDLIITCLVENEDNLVLNCKIPLTNQGLTVLQMSANTFQILEEKSGKSLLILKSKRESECSAWISHIQSVLQDVLEDGTSRIAGTSRKLELRVIGSTSTLWSLCFTGMSDMNFFVGKVQDAYHAYMDSITPLYLQDYYRTIRGATDEPIIPSVSLTGGNDAELSVLRDLQLQAKEEYLLTREANLQLESVTKYESTYSDLRGGLQKIVLVNPTGSGRSKMVSKQGTSTFNTLRKALNI